MTSTRRSHFSTLLPVPKILREAKGMCRVSGESPLAVHVNDSRAERAARRWWERCPARSTAKETPPSIRIAVDRMAANHSDGYRLTVSANELELLGGSPAGCYHGLQTLSQLTDFATGGVPCCTIDDFPDYATRGLLHDMTRGKVPTLDTLKTLADRLSVLKVNQLQLYIEHAFTFAFDPDICGPDDGLTPDEIRELDVYCKERFIDLVPAVATLGHMGRILSMPKYRHLAEIEPTQSWEGIPWPQRARGFTLDVMNPDARALVGRIWTEILDAFTSPMANICGDEPWDLGKGKNREAFAAAGTGPPYIDHILRTHAMCAARGRQTQVWGDVVRNHPDLFDRLPKGLTVLHWGYDDRADYDGARAFTEAGLDTVVCPGTSGWKRILNAMNLAERNIAAFAGAGRKHGAIGLLNTDWGDHGHFNALACSWHGIALGAAFGWNVDHPTGVAFDERFAPTMLGLSDSKVISALRQASAIAERCETWRVLWQPREQIRDDPTVPTAEDAEGAAESARKTMCHIESLKSSHQEVSGDLAELTLSCRFTEVFAEKLNYERGVRTDFADRLSTAALAYSDSWRARNKPSGLNDILDALRRVANDIESPCRQMARPPNP